MARTATPGPAPKVARTIASTHQEAASSKAPAVSDSVPSDELDRPVSLMMRASIGKAVRAIQAPRNRVALAWEIPLANRPGTFSRKGVIATATRKGATMPDKDTAKALLAFDLKWPAWKLVPTINM